MEYRRLGSSGLELSALSFGSWITFGTQLDEQTAAECMRAAFDAGVNFFDNAEAYAHGVAESMMGSIIKKARWPRSELVVSTKLFWGGDKPNHTGLSRKHIAEGIDASLKRLQLDYVDLLFCHRPDLHTPIEETVRAMSHVVSQGKALYWGTSEWSAQQITEAYGIARAEHLIPPQMEQPEYNMFDRERVEKEYKPLYRTMGLGTTIWSPLAGGILTGKYNEGIPPQSRAALPGLEWLRHRYVGERASLNIEKVRQLAPLAKDLGCTLSQLGLAWCLKNPDVSSVITGASRPEHVRENMKAVDVAAKLDDEVLGRIEEMLENRPEPEPDYR